MFCYFYLLLEQLSLARMSAMLCAVNLSGPRAPITLGNSVIRIEDRGTRIEDRERSSSHHTLQKRHTDSTRTRIKELEVTKIKDKEPRSQQSLTKDNAPSCVS